ncbi:ParB/RepB/Spo0J family partition protein [Paraclostridium tenue]|uniref:ParB-like N-terminal domain-containing protein n=1 Tax=Paraclostridium tenue TaxID=1737 RepID=A0ABN1M9G5_9FIRM
MAKKFSISEGMLSSISKNTEKVVTLEAKDNFKFEYIDIDNIVPNIKNFYEISNIDELAEDISLNGLNHNLVVRPIENNKYELISGERRYTAIKKLIDKGENHLKLVPCKIKTLNDLDAEIVLIQANAQSRELTESDRLKQIERLTELYNIKKNKGEKVGRIRERISEDTGLSPAQVGRYATISKGLIQELRDLLDKGNLSISNANEFATLSEENQRIILDIINKEVNISKKEANELKEKFKKIEKDKEDLLKKQNEYIEDIKLLKQTNEKNTQILNDEINKVKSELKTQLDSENNFKAEQLKKLEEEKKILEQEKEKLEKELKKEGNIKNIENIVNEKTKEVISKFEKENKKLKHELGQKEKESENLTINHELKLRLKSVRKDMSKVTGLLANNKIIDESTIKEVENLKHELIFLNEQIDIYINQEKIK